MISDEKFEYHFNQISAVKDILWQPLPGFVSENLRLIPVKFIRDQASKTSQKRSILGRLKNKINPRKPGQNGAI